MAGRIEHGSEMTMIVTNTPARDLAYTNHAYCSPSDARKFLVPGSDLALASVGDEFVLTISSNGSVPEGQIGLNSIQRRLVIVSTGESIRVARFVPPEDFYLALLTLELEFLKKGIKEEQIDAVLLAQQIRKRFNKQVMTAGQRVTFEYLGSGFVFRVTQATIEGQEKSKNIERGMILDDTYIIFAAPNSSGIKIVNQGEAASLV